MSSPSDLSTDMAFPSELDLLAAWPADPGLLEHFNLAELSEASLSSPSAASPDEMSPLPDMPSLEVPEVTTGVPMEPSSITEPGAWAPSMKIPKNKPNWTFRLRPDRPGLITPVVTIPSAHQMGLNLFNPDHRPQVLIQRCDAAGNSMQGPDELVAASPTTFEHSADPVYRFVGSGISIELPILLKTSCFKAGCGTFRIVIYIPAVDSWCVCSDPFVVA